MTYLDDYRFLRCPECDGSGEPFDGVKCGECDGFGTAETICEPITLADLDKIAA